MAIKIQNLCDNWILIKKKKKTTEFWVKSLTVCAPLFIQNICLLHNCTYTNYIKKRRGSLCLLLHHLSKAAAQQSFTHSFQISAMYINSKKKQRRYRAAIKKTRRKNISIFNTNLYNADRYLFKCISYVWWKSKRKNLFIYKQIKTGTITP